MKKKKEVFKKSPRYTLHSWMIDEFGFTSKLGAYLLIFSFYESAIRRNSKKDTSCSLKDTSCSLTLKDFGNYLAKYYKEKKKDLTDRQVLDILNELKNDGYINFDSEPPKRTVYSINKGKLKELKEKYSEIYSGTEFSIPEKYTEENFSVNENYTEENLSVHTEENFSVNEKHTEENLSVHTEENFSVNYIINNKIDNISLIDRENRSSSLEKADSEFEKILTENINEPSSLDEVKSYIKENNYISDAQHIFEYYQNPDIGWRKPWKQLIDEWEIREQAYLRKKKPTSAPITGMCTYDNDEYLKKVMQAVHTI